MMESGRLFFDPTACGGSNMLLLGNGENIFRGGRAVMSMEESSKRRSFFSSQDELVDEEYFDEQLPEKKRRLSPEQVHLLEKSFETENKLEPERKTQLAKKLGLQPRQVAVWFQNRRARWKTKQLERDYDVLKSSYDSLYSNYDTLVKEHEKLKSEVVSLNEKLQAKGVAGADISAQKAEPLPGDITNVSALQFSVKVEDRLSCGSAVVDEDGPQILDTGDSYFPSDNYPAEDDGSDDGHSYFCNVFVAAEPQHQEDEEPLEWLEWP